MTAIQETDEQRTGEWFQARLGHATASRFADVMAVLKSGKPAKAREDYAIELVTERLTGNVTQKFVTAAMQWGTENEFAARELFKARRGLVVEEVGFMRHPEIAAGASPDGLIPFSDGLEIKCPFNSAVHLRTLLDGMPSEHTAQVQGQMWIADLESVWFVSYDPRFPPELALYVQQVSRDGEFIKRLEEQVRGFLDEVSAMEVQLRERYL